MTCKFKNSIVCNNDWVPSLMPNMLYCQLFRFHFESISRTFVRMVRKNTLHLLSLKAILSSEDCLAYYVR